VATAQQCRILAIGQFPPPYHGFSIISQAFVDAIGGEREVVKINTAAPGQGSRAGHYLRRLGLLSQALARLLRERLRGPATLYLPCEGDAGLVLTLALVASGRLLGCPTVLHHHSFGYINAPSRLMRAVVRSGGHQLRHVFLCQIMQDAYVARYGPVAQSWTQSNAAFVPVPAAPAAAARSADGLVIGHLSNLTREKGLHTFLELFRAARSRGLPVRAVLAGPAAAAADAAAIAQTCGEFPGAFEYRGPLLGAQKDAFYQAIDVFVFPTDYANEAQPVVLFEAQAHGNLVASKLRGCIAAQLGDDALAVTADQNFLASTLPWLESLLARGAQLGARKTAVGLAFRSAHAQAQAQLRQLAAAL